MSPLPWTEPVIDEAIVRALRKCASDGGSTADIADVFLQFYSYSNPKMPFKAVVYFRKAFLIDLKFCKEWVGAKRLNGGAFDDDEIESRIMPHIIETRHK